MITWTQHPNRLVVNLDRVQRLFWPKVAQIVETQAARGEGLAKISAPWQDQTGRARSGLRGTSDVSGDKAEIVLSYNVDYGIWLELANSGRFATVIPTMEIIGAETVHALGGVLG